MLPVKFFYWYFLNKSMTNISRLVFVHFRFAFWRKIGWFSGCRLVKIGVGKSFFFLCVFWNRFLTQIYRLHFASNILYYLMIHGKIAFLLLIQSHIFRKIRKNVFQPKLACFSGFKFDSIELMRKYLNQLKHNFRRNFIFQNFT